MVQDHRGEYPFLWAATESISTKIGCVHQAFIEWVEKSAAYSGLREGVSCEEPDRIKALGREFKEVLRAH